MRIDSTFSLLASNRLQATARAIGRSLERLSTGQRINSARDDAASFSMSIRLDAEARGFRQSIQSMNQAQSLLQTASSTISSQMDLVQRMRELALQSLNGTLSTADRENLNTEFRTLHEEFERLAREAKFNDLHLLDGSEESIRLLLGPNAGDSMEFTMPSTISSDTMLTPLGTGAFSFSSTLAAGNSNFASEAQDLNGDGNLDLAVFSQNSDIVSIYLGRGDGTFETRRTYGAGGNGINYMKAVDLNNDGILDLTGVRSGIIATFIGRGDGTYDSVQTIVTGLGTYQKIKSGDLDHDGNQDLVTTNFTDSTISIHYGKGDGTFEERVTISGASNDIDVGDMDGDGIDDLVSNEGDLITIRRSLGASRQFATTITSTVSSSIALGDLNDDGRLDIYNTDATVMKFLINQGGLTFTTTTQALPAGGQDPIITDLNGDHFGDLLFAATGPLVLAYYGNGSGVFSPTWTLSSPVNSPQAVAGDFNGDGIADVVVGGSAVNNVYLYTQNTTEHYSAQDMSIATSTKAGRALAALDNALTNLTEAQAFLGAYSTRLDYALNHSQSMVDVLEEANANNRTADYAEEIAELTRNQILQQAQLAVMAQANLQMQVVLGLLKG